MQPTPNTVVTALTPLYSVYLIFCLSPKLTEYTYLQQFFLIEKKNWFFYLYNDNIITTNFL